MKSMLNISEAYSLALHAMSMVGAEKNGAAVTAHDIASRLGVSEAHLSKVLQRLVRARILRSSRGPGGGFSLNRPAVEITLRDIYEGVEGPLQLEDCLIGTQICGGKSCVFDDLIHKVNSDFKNYLEHTTVERIKDVLKE
ncbi:MAG: Rrf2 family transcriptional regulator [Actinomycetota bacterium]|nr:Rrf2 family transcriptional regulator [Actinomycetota bacterium]MDD5667666.1 Rrf2 family transcriptional regulator [Actinomycetota bacterium]